MKKLILLSFTFLLLVSAQAASKYWVSSGSSTWNTSANWSATSGGSGGAGVPGASDVAYFDGGGSKNGNCSIDAIVNVAGISITGYSGTVTQGSGYTITVGASNFTQSTGTFAGGNSSFDLNGGFYLTGGTFTATSGIMYVSLDWSHSSGGTFTHNSGTVTFDAASSTYVSMVGGAETYYNLTFDKAGGNSVIINTENDRMISAGTLTFSLGNIASGFSAAKYIEAQGNVVVLNTFGYIAEYITLKFTGTANQNFDLSGATNKVDGAITIDKSSGTVTLLSALTMDSNKGLNLTSGTLNLNGQTVTITAANSTCGGTFTLAGTGTLANYGWTQSSASAALTISSSPTFSIGSGHYTQSNGTFSAGGSTLDFNGNFNFTGGTFTASSGTMTISGNWSHSTSGTFNHNNGTVTFDGASGSIVSMVGGAETFYNLTFDKAGNNTVDIPTTDDRMISAGTLTFSLGNISSSYMWAKYIEAQGNVVVLSTFGTIYEYITLKFSGTANQNFDLSAATNKVDGPITIDKSSGTVSLLSALTMDSNRGLNLTSGTLNLNGQLLTNSVANTTCGGTFVIAGTGTLANYGWDQTSSSAALTISSSPTLSFGGGNFNQSNGTFSGTSATLDINGNFNFTGGTFTAPTGTMTISGNWSHSTSGTFNHNNGTVTFDGASGSIVSMVGGAETFYNLTFDKSSSNTVSINNENDRMISAGTLTFNQGNIVSSFIQAKYIEANGNVVVSSSFGTIAEYITLKFSGTANQNFDLTGGTNKVDGAITIDKSSGTVTLLSALTMDSNKGLNLTSGTLNLNGKTLTNSVANTICTGTFVIAGTGTLANYGWTQTSGSPALSISSSPTLSIGGGNFTQSSGTFSGGGATFDFNGSFIFTGGTFTAPSGNMTVSGDWSHSTSGTFNHNNGTITFDGANPSYVSMIANSEIFYNLTFDKPGGNGVFINTTADRMISAGTLNFNQGAIVSGFSAEKFIEARGDVNVLSGYGYVAEYISLHFGGSASVQTFTFGGGVDKINGHITVNKTSGKVNLGSPVTVYSNKIFTVTAGTLNCLNQVVYGSTFTLASGATLELGSTGGIASSGATGNIQTTTRTFNTGSYYVYSGISGAQVTGTGLPSTIAGLTINNSSGVTLTTSETINTLFTLTSGNLTIGTCNIIMASGSSISGGSSSSFVYTGSTGFLKYNSCAASSTKTFPVGHTNSSAGYIPLVITFNTGHTTDDFNVIAVDKVTNDGTRNGTAYTSTVVKAMWFITETTSGGSNVNMQFQWNGTDEASGFVRSSCHMSHYTNSAWENPGSNASASGSNPYTFTHNNYTGTFSPFGMGGSGGPLPVKLLFFNVKKENSTGLITWATAMEQDNDYFELEKSADGKNFKTIGKIEGAGNSQQILKYNFIDSELESGINYYRLKQTDYNGDFSYSDIEVILNSNEQNRTLNFKLYPVPASSNITVELNSNRDLEETPIKIINVFGATVLEKNISLHEGYNQFEIDVNDLSGGIYFIQIDGVIGYKNTRFSINK